MVIMAGEWHTLHRIEQVSNLIRLLREYETNTLRKNAIVCSNCDDLLNLSFILKIPIFSETYLPSRTKWCSVFLRKSSGGNTGK